MSIMITELYDALKSANAPEDKALAAATAMAQYENRFAGIEGELKLHRWILAANTGLLVAILLKLFL